MPEDTSDFHTHDQPLISLCPLLSSEHWGDQTLLHAIFSTAIYWPLVESLWCDEKSPSLKNYCLASLPGGSRYHEGTTLSGLALTLISMCWPASQPCGSACLRHPGTGIILAKCYAWISFMWGPGTELRGKYLTNWAISNPPASVHLPWILSLQLIPQSLFIFPLLVTCRQRIALALARGIARL